MCVNASDYKMESWDETLVKEKFHYDETIKVRKLTFDKSDDQIHNSPKQTKLYMGDYESFKIESKDGNVTLTVNVSGEEVTYGKDQDGQHWCLDLVTQKCSDDMTW